MKHIIWVGNTLKELQEFSTPVKKQVGFGLHLAQKGETHMDVKSFGRHGGEHVLEHVVDSKGDTYRSYFTVSLGDSIYVLHVWKKKSKRGKATPKSVTDLVRRRVLEAKAHALERRKE